MSYDKQLKNIISYIIYDEANEWEYHKIYNPHGLRPTLIAKILRFLRLK